MPLTTVSESRMADDVGKEQRYTLRASASRFHSDKSPSSRFCSTGIEVFHIFVNSEVWR